MKLKRYALHIVQAAYSSLVTESHFVMWKYLIVCLQLVLMIHVTSAEETPRYLLLWSYDYVGVYDTQAQVFRPLGSIEVLEDLTITMDGVSLSPEGTKLALVSVIRTAGGWYDELLILDLNTGDMQIVPAQSDSEEVIGPVWSPDGRYVAYLIGGGGWPGAEMGIYDTQARTEQRYPFGGENLRWSPDGQYLLAGVRSYIDEETGWINNIWMFDINDSDIFGITGDDLNMLHAEWLADSSGIIGLCSITAEIHAFCQVPIGERPAREAIILHQFNPGEFILDFDLIGSRIVFVYNAPRSPGMLDLTTRQVTSLEFVNWDYGWRLLGVLSAEEVGILDNPPFLSQPPTCDATIPAATCPP